MGYIVTALDKRKHNSRNVISKSFSSKQQAQSFIGKWKKDYSKALPKYRTLHKFKIEKR